MKVVLDEITVHEDFELHKYVDDDCAKDVKNKKGEVTGVTYQEKIGDSNFHNEFGVKVTKDDNVSDEDKKAYSLMEATKYFNLLKARKDKATKPKFKPVTKYKRSK